MLHRPKSHKSTLYASPVFARLSRSFEGWQRKGLFLCGNGNPHKSPIFSKFVFVIEGLPISVPLKTRYLRDATLPSHQSRVGEHHWRTPLSFRDRRERVCLGTYPHGVDRGEVFFF